MNVPYLFASWLPAAGTWMLSGWVGPPDITIRFGRGPCAFWVVTFGACWRFPKTLRFGWRLGISLGSTSGFVGWDILSGVKLQNRRKKYFFYFFIQKIFSAYFFSAYFFSAYFFFCIIFFLHIFFVSVLFTINKKFPKISCPPHVCLSFDSSCLLLLLSVI